MYFSANQCKSGGFLSWINHIYVIQEWKGILELFLLPQVLPRHPLKPFFVKIYYIGRTQHNLISLNINYYCTISCRRASVASGFDWLCKMTESVAIEVFSFVRNSKKYLSSQWFAGCVKMNVLLLLHRLTVIMSLTELCIWLLFMFLKHIHSHHQTEAQPCI